MYDLEVHFKNGGYPLRFQGVRKYVTGVRFVTVYTDVDGEVEMTSVNYDVISHVDVRLSKS